MLVLPLWGKTEVESGRLQCRGVMPSSIAVRPDIIFRSMTSCKILMRLIFVSVNSPDKLDFSIEPLQSWFA